MSAVNSAAVLKQARVTETVLTLIASKKAIQCAAVMAPVSNNSAIVRALATMGMRANFIKMKIATSAINILHQTSGSLGTVMSLPMIPVKPKMSTIKCNSNRLAVLFFSIFGHLCHPSRNYKLHNLH